MPLGPHTRQAVRVLLAAAALILAALPAVAAVLTDAAGRRVALPENVRRVLPAERNAEILVYVLTPDKLAGLQRPAAEGGRTPAAVLRPPVLRFRPGTTVSGIAAAARNARADVILDAGPVTPERAAFANEVQQRAGIPYVLVGNSFDRMQSILRTVGTVLGVPERANELRLFAENAIGGTRGGLLIRPAETRARVYYGLGPDGLTTALPGAPAAETLAEAGAINVAAPLGRDLYARIGREQLLTWDPDIIIAQYPRFYDALRRDRSWRRLSAVRNDKVYLEPSAPFSWIGDPSGVNRLIGLSWLSALFYPEPTHGELRAMVCEFYDRFYRVRLTNAQLNDMIEPAGIPRPEPPRPIASPLAGIGAVPTAPAGVPAPPTAPGAAPEATGTVPALPPELRAVPGEPAFSGAIPVIPGTVAGIPGVPNVAPLPALPDQPDALCTVPGVASPIVDLTGPAPLPGAPGGRLRRPGPGGMFDTPLSPGLAPNPGP
ncbi:MAG: ABC transporter substrate-binding protein [Alphaproteobacteria bacterium]